MANLNNLVGQILDEKYQIEKKLGQGGMGAVYLAIHLGTKRPVALKVIVPKFMAQPEAVERFKREAEATGRLTHPNVINVTDFGFAPFPEGQLAYLVMEYLNGETLSEMLQKKGRLALSLVVELISQVSLAVHYAHLQGIIHRDLKPENIWLEPNGREGYHVKVLDFGLAKLRESSLPRLSEFEVEESLLNEAAISDLSLIEETGEAKILEDEETRAINTRELMQHPGGSFDRSAFNNVLTPKEALRENITHQGSIMGTPLYMSPEQCLGKELDFRSDIYSLGVMTYQMLAGELPFEKSQHLYSILVQHLKQTPIALDKKCPDIPKAVCRVVSSALEKKLVARPESAETFANTLKVSAENESNILYQTISLYNDHFSDFLRIAMIGYSWTLLGVVALFSCALIPFFQTPFWVFTLCFFFLVTQLFTGFFSSCWVLPKVLQKLDYRFASFQPKKVLQLGLFRFKPYFAGCFRTNYWVLIPPTLFAFAVNIHGGLQADYATLYYENGVGIVSFYLLLLTIALLFAFKNYTRYILFPPVALLEGLKGKAMVERTDVLGKRLAGFARKIFPFFYSLMLSICLLAVTLSYSFAKHLKQGWSFFDSTVEIASTLFGLGLSILLSIGIAPIVGIGYIFFYLKARQIGGESLEELLDSCWSA